MDFGICKDKNVEYKRKDLLSFHKNFKGTAAKNRLFISQG